MKARLVGLAAALSLTSCTTQVVDLSCHRDSDCSNAYCNLSGGQGVCVACEARELSCADGMDQDCDGKTDCADEDCQAVPCRAATGPCDEAEYCAQGVCPDDSRLAQGTSCREESACGPAAVCDGVSAQCPGAASAGSQGAVCRDQGCAEKATCDGVSPDCPPLVLKEAGTVCGELDLGPCMVAGVCDGASPVCPAPELLPATALCPDLKGCEVDRFCSGVDGLCAGTPTAKGEGSVCRASAGRCDLEEACDGTSLECPADAKVEAGTVCREAADLCEKETLCDGVTAECPLLLKGAGEICREAVGKCDLAEACSGSDSACPADELKPAQTVCRDAAGKCDVAEVCDGSSGYCPDDEVKPADTVCREKQGDCDVAEACDGVSAYCPEDAVVQADAICREKQGLCDVAEACDGVGKDCPADALASAGELCKLEGVCAHESRCTGSDATCPGPDLKAAGTVCGNAENPCVLPSTCDANGSCVAPPNATLGSLQCGLTTSEVCIGNSSGAAPGCSWPTALVSSANGWTWENPLPQGNNLLATVSSGGTRYFVGEAGTVLSYADSIFNVLPAYASNGAGMTLARLRSALNAACVDPNGTLWVVGAGGYVGRSAYAATGLSVFAEPTGLSTTEDLVAVWCEGAGKILTVGVSGTVSRWDHVTSSLTSDGLVAKHPMALWGSSLTDLWVVGMSGAVSYRVSDGNWQTITCQDSAELVLTGVGSAPGGQSDLWIVGHALDESASVVGTYRVRRISSGSGPACEAAPDADLHPPASLYKISVSGSMEAWAVGQTGKAFRMNVNDQGNPVWSEPIPVGISRAMAAVDASTDAVAVAGVDGAISVYRTLDGQKRWLPSRTLGHPQLNGLWTASLSATATQAYAVGDGRAVFERSANQWWTRLDVSAIAEEDDDLTCIDDGAGLLDLWVGGTSVDGKGLLFSSLNNATREVAFPDSPVTSIGASAGYVTVAAGTVRQKARSGTFTQLGSEPATVLVTPSIGSQVVFARDAVYLSSGASSGAATPTLLSTFPTSSDPTTPFYTGLDATFDYVSETAPVLAHVFAAATDKVAYHVVFTAGIPARTALTCSLREAPRAVKAVSGTAYWVVGDGGLAKLCDDDVSANDVADWAGTGLGLRAVALDASGSALAVGERGIILRRSATTATSDP